MGQLSFEWLDIPNRPGDAEPLLAMEHVSVRLGQRLVLDDISLTVYEGEQVRITGPNGSGKSTLLNAIMGIVPVAMGTIRFRGEDLIPLATHERASRGIRYMRQRGNVFPTLSVRENLTLCLGSKAYERFKERFPDWADDLTAEKLAGMLSGGQKQKLALAMTVLPGSALALLDEPMAGIADAKNFPPIFSTLTKLTIEHN